MAYIETLLMQWETYGVFDYMLPFFLIFAVIFGILTTTNVFGSNRAVHVIISLVVGLMALRLGYVQNFFTEIFPRTGVALAVILVVVILTSIFIPDAHKGGWAIAFYSIGGLAALVVIFGSFSQLNFFGSDLWYQWEGVILLLVFIGVVVAISVAGGRGNSQSKPASFSSWRPETH